jgi:hypothetical protein
VAGDRSGALVAGLDLLVHEAFLEHSDGRMQHVALKPNRPVGEVMREVLGAARSLGGPLEIDPTSQEVWWSVPLDEDDEQATYDAEAVASYFIVATRAALVLAAFRAPYRGRSTPVTAWWGSFDLAVNLFSGSPADPPSGDFIMRNAMGSRNTSSIGTTSAPDSTRTKPRSASRVRPFATPAPFANGTRVFSPAPKEHLAPDGGSSPGHRQARRGGGPAGVRGSRRHLATDCRTPEPSR